MKKKAFSLIELLIIVAIVAVLMAILFPVFSQAAAEAKKSNAVNLKKITQAAFHYSADADERIPIVSNGPYRDLKNVDDGVLTQYGEQRTDLWPRLLLPYLKDNLDTFVDPARGDTIGIWSGPALATTDAGYNVTENTYRNQNRFPMFAFNYMYLSPMEIPSSKMVDATPTDFMVGEVHEYFQAFDPADTVFYTASQRGYIGTGLDDNIGVLDSARGFFGVDAPCLWDVLIGSTTPYVIFWDGTYCSADWCGGDVDPNTPGVQTRENFFYKDPDTSGNNFAFLDGHVRFMTATQAAAGTTYPVATPTDGGSGYFGGGGTIIDKSQYLWNLDQNYYGA